MTAHWSLKKLGDIFDIARGGSPRPIEDFITTEPDGLNWIKIGDASASGKYIERTKEKIRREGLSKTRLVKPGDFLLTNSMSFGRPYIMATEGCIHDGWLVLNPRVPELVHPDYFYYLLSSDTMYGQFAARAGGSTVKNLNSEIVASVEVRLPPLDEQRRIAAILDKADALRRKRKRALELLDGLTQSIFLEMFGDPVSNPIGWPTPSVAEVCKRVTVGIVVKPASYYQLSGIPALRSLNIRENDFDLSDLVYVNSTDNDGALAKSKIYKNDVVIVRTGQPGKAAVVSEKLHGANAIDILITSTKADVLDPQYFCDLLNSRAGKAIVLANKRGQIQQHLNAGSLKAAKFPVPPIHIQHEYVCRSQVLRNTRAITRLAIKDLDALFPSLQHRAFSGQL